MLGLAQVGGAVKVQPGAAFLPRRAASRAKHEKSLAQKSVCKVSAHLTQMLHVLG